MNCPWTGREGLAAALPSHRRLHEERIRTRGRGKRRHGPTQVQVNKIGRCTDEENLNLTMKRCNLFQTGDNAIF